MEPAEHADQFRVVESRNICRDEGFFPFVPDDLIDFLPGLRDEFLDTRWVDATVLHELDQRHAGNFASYWIETRKRHGFRRVIDDEIDARGILERTDVAPFSTDDPRLHLLVWQGDDRDGGLHRLFRCVALNRGDDHVSRPALAFFTRLCLDLADAP